ncbi:hypothetical protein Tco_0026126, partial [Tanacetum coccineum]
MQIPAWMITEEMKHTEHYRMTPSAPRSPNPNKEAAESSAPRRSTVIRLRIPERRSTRLTPPAPVPNVDKADEMILQDTLQVSLAEHKSRKEQEARENVALIEPRSNKESPEVEITKDKEVEITKDKEVEITKETPVVDITNVVIPVNVNDEDEEITDEEFTWTYGYLFAHLRARFMPRKSFDTLLIILHDVMVETLPTIVDKHIKEQVISKCPEHKQQYQLYLAMKADPQLQQQDIAIWLALQMKFERNTVQLHVELLSFAQEIKTFLMMMLILKGNSAKRQKTIEYEAYVSESHRLETNDNEIITKQVSQDIMEEVSLTIDEAKLRKMADEMLRQRCTLGDEHQYHIDQKKNFLKSDIVWESRKEILVSPHLRKTTPLVHSCQQDPEAPALSLINQDLLYLKIGNFRHREDSLATSQVILRLFFNEGEGDDIEERTSRWKVNLIAPTMTFPGIEDHEMFSIIYEPAHGIITRIARKETSDETFKIHNFVMQNIKIEVVRMSEVIINDTSMLNTTYPLPSDTAYPTFCPIQRIHFKLINMAYPLPLDTAYRSSETESDHLKQNPIL